MQLVFNIRSEIERRYECLKPKDQRHDSAMLIIIISYESLLSI